MRPPLLLFAVCWLSLLLPEAAALRRSRSPSLGRQALRLPAGGAPALEAEAGTPAAAEGRTGRLRDWRLLPLRVAYLGGTSAMAAAFATAAAATAAQATAATAGAASAGALEVAGQLGGAPGLALQAAEGARSLADSAALPGALVLGSLVLLVALDFYPTASAQVTRILKLGDSPEGRELARTRELKTYGARVLAKVTMELGGIVVAALAGRAVLGAQIVLLSHAFFLASTTHTLDGAKFKLVHPTMRKVIAVADGVLLALVTMVAAPWHAASLAGAAAFSLLSVAAVAMRLKTVMKKRRAGEAAGPVAPAGREEGDREATPVGADLAVQQPSGF